MRDDAMVHRYEKTVSFLEHHGFAQYEVSNFAKPGYQSIHNQAYWNRKVYKGFGLGAASFDGKNRLVNEKNLTSYIDYWSEGKNINIKVKSAPQAEMIDPEKEKLEVVMLGLRQKKGMDLHRVIYYVNPQEKADFYRKIQALQERLLVEIEGDILRLTVKGMALENEIVIHLF